MKSVYCKPTTKVITVSTSTLMSMSVGGPDETVGGGFSNGIRNPFSGFGGFGGFPPLGGNPFTSFFSNPFGSEE